jgi:hypothetical protein
VSGWTPKSRISNGCHQRTTTHAGQTHDGADNKTGERIEPVHGRYNSAWFRPPNLVCRALGRLGARPKCLYLLSSSRSRSCRARTAAGGEFWPSKRNYHINRERLATNEFLKRSRSLLRMALSSAADSRQIDSRYSMSGFSLATSSCVTSLPFSKSFIDPDASASKRRRKLSQFVVRVHRHLSCRIAPMRRRRNDRSHDPYNKNGQSCPAQVG